MIPNDSCYTYRFVPSITHQRGFIQILIGADLETHNQVLSSVRGILRNREGKIIETRRVKTSTRTYRKESTNQVSQLFTEAEQPITKPAWD